MKIYKTSKTEVFGQQAYDSFASAIKQKIVSWDDRNQQFRHVSNIVVGGKNSFEAMVMEKFIFGTIHAERGTRTPDYALRIKVYHHKDERVVPSKWEVSLLNEKQRMTTICEWSNYSDTEDCVYGSNSGSLSVFMRNLGLQIKLPKDEMKNLSNLKVTTIDGDKKAWGFERLTKSKSRFDTAKAIEIWIEKVESFGTQLPQYSLMYRSIDLESGFVGDIRQIKEEPGDPHMTASEILQTYDNYITRAKSNGYVSQDSFEYIAKDANPNTWDFVLNKPIGGQQNVQPEPSINKEKEEPMAFPRLRKILFDSHLKSVIAQDFSGYYSGAIPDPEQASRFIGSPSVEASQIRSVFGKADEAIHLVNSFNGELLRNIAFIFNSQGGSYGVYLSEMDRAIKTKFLAKQLEQKGYKVVNENGLLTANPTKEDIPSEQVQQDIDALYAELNQKGGTAIGINMAKIVDSARQDANNIPSPEPNYLFEQLAILHLGETIVHEAIHAKGNNSEGPSESAEAQFVNWYLPQLNEKYKSHLQNMGKEEEYTEIIISQQKRHAVTSNWYKLAQNYGGLFGHPTGSDLSGRMRGKQEQGGRADWSMLFNQQSSESIEKRLGRQFMWPLDRDIDQANDITEEQLRKSTRQTIKTDSDRTMEELLGKDRMTADDSYKSMETLLDEKRPSPLMTTLKKASLNKLATLFGWYNNLEISDGNTIPGLGDRVMAWDDRDEDFATDDQTIRGQPRYNPEYDETGMFYRFIEPRFKPQLFDDMNNELSNTHPARRFASIGDEDFKMIVDIIGRAKNALAKGKVKAIRFVVSEDLVETMAKVFGEYEAVICPLSGRNEDISALWIKVNGVADEDIAAAEKFFGGDKSFESKVEELTGMVGYRGKILEAVFAALKSIDDHQKLSKIYLIGEAAREYITKSKITSPTLHFVCMQKEDALKYGQALANILGEQFSYNSSNDLVICHGDFRFAFHSGNNDRDCDLMKEMTNVGYDIRNPVILELLNKDFRINMIGYSICDGQILDPLNVMEDINNKQLDTEFDADIVIKSNPSIIVRAMKFIKVDGFTPSDELTKAIENNYELLSSMDESSVEQARVFWKFNRIT